MSLLNWNIWYALRTVWEPIRLALHTARTGYSSACIERWVNWFIQYSAWQVDRLLRDWWNINRQSLSSSISHALLSNWLSLEDITIVSSVLSDEAIIKVLLKWCDNKPSELQNLKLDSWESSYNKIVEDLVGELTRNKNLFIQWLATLQEKKDTPKKASWFKSGWICFTIFWIYLPDGTQLWKNTYDNIITLNKLFQFTWRSILVGSSIVYETKKDDAPTVSYRYYTQEGAPFEGEDLDNNKYLVNKLSNWKAYARKIWKPQEKVMSSWSVWRVVRRRSEWFRWYWIDPNWWLIPLDNTSPAPSSQELRSVPAENNVPEAVNPPQE